MLKQIADWNRFEINILKERETDCCRPTSLTIGNALDASNWNNIPLPLVEALKRLRYTLDCNENAFFTLCKETKVRTEQTAMKFKKIDESNHDRDSAIRNLIDQTKSKLVNLLEQKS